jgi:hypothetical protein
MIVLASADLDKKSRAGDRAPIGSQMDVQNSGNATNEVVPNLIACLPCGASDRQNATGRAFYD